jgi:hypothetical protein
MMLGDADKESVIRCAKKYNISAVYVFSEPYDAVLGIEYSDSRLFFRFYGELMKAITVPFDVMDLSVDSLYSKNVKKEGVKIHG